MSLTPCSGTLRFLGAKLVLSAQTHFSKRYLKYLTKKFLKKNQLEVSRRLPLIVLSAFLTQISVTVTELPPSRRHRQGHLLLEVLQG